MAIDTRGPQLLACVIFMLTFSWIFVLLRFYCKLAVVKKFRFDDYFCFTSQVLFTCQCACTATTIYYGAGRHFQDISPANIPTAIMWWYLAEPVYFGVSAAQKLSVGLFLLQFVVFRTQRIILWAAILIGTISNAYIFLLLMFQCRPISYFWTASVGGIGSCIDPDVVLNSSYAYSAVACVVDWTFCIMPTIMVWNLPMSRRTRTSVIIILSLSAIASSATIVRLAYVKSLKNRADFLYATTSFAICSVTEAGLGTAASAAATLRPLLRKYTSSRRRSEQYGNNDSNSKGADDSVGMASARKQSRTGGSCTGNISILDIEGQIENEEVGSHQSVGLADEDGKKVETSCSSK